MEDGKRMVARLFVSFGSETEVEDDYFDVYLWMREDGKIKIDKIRQNISINKAIAKKKEMEVRKEQKWSDNPDMRLLQIMDRGKKDLECFVSQIRNEEGEEHSELRIFYLMLWNMFEKDATTYTIEFRDKISGEDFILTFLNIERGREDERWQGRNFKYHEESLIGMLQNPQKARKLLATLLIIRDQEEEWFDLWEPSNRQI